MSEQPEVRWFSDRLPAWRMGLLSEQDEARFRELLMTSPPCRDLYEALRSATPECPDSLEHLPSGWIARWPEMMRSLRGAEREVARGHLETCEECRSDLKLLGHEPSLPHVPELELDAVKRKAVFGDGGAVEGAGPVPILRSWAESLRAVFFGRPQVLLGGWAAVATAALLLVLVGEREAPVRMESASLADVGVVLRGEAETAVLRVSADDRSVVLAVDPPQELRADAFVELELKDPSGAVIARFSGGLADVKYPRLLVVRSERQLEEGDYRLRFSSQDGKVASELLIPIRRHEALSPQPER